MKVALSIPDDLFEKAETLGKRLGVSRSRLYASALADFLAKHRGGKVTQRLNTVYATQDSQLEPGVRRLQRRSLERNPW
jgi:metal-responsive CopG/Arc/MetJ family transcriptional regulator